MDRWIDKWANILTYIEDKIDRQIDSNTRLHHMAGCVMMRAAMSYRPVCYRMKAFHRLQAALHGKGADFSEKRSVWEENELAGVSWSCLNTVKSLFWEL